MSKEELKMKKELKAFCKRNEIELLDIDSILFALDELEAYSNSDYYYNLKEYVYSTIEV